MPTGKLVDLARMSTSTTGQGPVTLKAAVPGLLSFAAAGVKDGDVVSYGIVDGIQSEVGTGVYSAGNLTLTRDVSQSTNSKAPIVLSGKAQVFVTGRAEDYSILITEKAPLDSPAFTGTPTVSADPTVPLGIASKNYVDNKAGVPGPQGPPGSPGSQGPQGPAGPGVATGGTAGQILAKIDSTNYNTQWVNVSSAASAITFTPTGNVAATNVQAAIAELDSEKLALTGGTLTGNVTVNGVVTCNYLNANQAIAATTTITAGQGGATGQLYLGNTGTHYLYFDGSNYTLANGAVFASNGRLWGASDGTPLWTGGGTMTGNITTNPSVGNINYGGATQSLMVIANSPTEPSITFHMQGAFAMNFGMGSDWNLWFGGWSHGSAKYQLWSSRDFNIANYMPVGGGGFTGYISAPTIYSTGNTWVYGGVLYMSSQGHYFQWDGSNYQMPHGGLYAQGVVQSKIGRLQSYGGSNPSVYVWSGSGHAYGFWTDGGSMSVGDLDGAGAGYANYFGISPANIYTPLPAYRPGGGPWLDSSDERIKTVLGNYEHGLAEVLQLNPVRYVFKGNDTKVPPTVFPEGTVPSEEAVKAAEEKDVIPPYRNSLHYQAAIDQTEFIGLIAQQVEPVMPEMVGQNEGYIDGQPVSDIRSLDSQALIFALVNAVKTLAARIDVLEAAALQAHQGRP